MLQEQTAPTHHFRLIVFNIEKNNNIGMLMRSAYAFGCAEVILVGKTKFKVTGAAGTYTQLKRTHFFSLQEAVAYCRQDGFAICGLEIGGRLLPGYQFGGDVAFILGNEGRGLADAEPYCDFILTIPQWGGVPSLNVGVAGSIAMYAFACQSNRPCAQAADQRYFDDFYALESQGNPLIEN